MERLKQNLEVAEKALQALTTLMFIEKPNDVERDAAIQRFEFTFEAVWKASRQFLLVVEGIDVGSPKGVIRACRENGILNEDETIHALLMADDRNLTVHTYNEVLAKEIFERMKRHAGLLNEWSNRIKDRVPGT